MAEQRVSDEDVEFYVSDGVWRTYAPTKLELALDLKDARQQIKELEKSLEMHEALRKMRFKEPE